MRVEGVKMDDNLWLIIIIISVVSAMLAAADLTWLDHCLGFDPGVKRTDSLQNTFLT